MLVIKFSHTTVSFFQGRIDIGQTRAYFGETPAPSIS